MNELGFQGEGRVWLVGLNFGPQVQQDSVLRVDPQRDSELWDNSGGL
jgi:hypothetical protein